MKSELRPAAGVFDRLCRVLSSKLSHSRLLGRPILSRLPGRPMLSRLPGRLRLWLSGRPMLSRLLGRPRVSRLLGRPRLSRLPGRPRLSRLPGRLLVRNGICSNGRPVALSLRTRLALACNAFSGVVGRLLRLLPRLLPRRLDSGVPSRDDRLGSESSSPEDTAQKPATSLMSIGCPARIRAPEAGSPRPSDGRGPKPSSDVSAPAGGGGGTVAARCPASVDARGGRAPHGGARAAAAENSSSKPSVTLRAQLQFVGQQVRWRRGRGGPRTPS